MALSGILLHIIDEHFKIETNYGLRTNPWLDEVKFVHNIFNFLFIFSVGRIYNGHIFLGLSLVKKKHQLTGFLITFAILILTLTGCSLLYVSDLEWSGILANLHWWVAVFFVFTFIFHYLCHFREKRKINGQKPRIK